MTATPAQIARNGHVAAMVRDLMKRKQWSLADFNKALGHNANYSPTHKWSRAEGLPVGENQTKLAKLLGVAPEELLPKSGRRAPKDVAVIPSIPVTKLGRPKADVLGFTVDTEGNATIKLNITLPLDKAQPLLRILLDANNLMVKDE